MRARFLWSLLASAVLNMLAWVSLSAHLTLFDNTQERAPRETLVVLRSPKTPPPRLPPAPAKDLGIAPPPASLALSTATWTRADVGIGTTDVAIWFDWRKQRSKWIPRVTLWGMKLDPLYMQRPSLRAAIHDIVSTLRRDAEVRASNAMQVCNGTRSGWFLSYVKPGDDPPLHFDEALFMVGGEIYRAMYIRALDQPEDPRMRQALTTLCWP